jgi:hypothetical protein
MAMMPEGEFFGLDIPIEFVTHFVNVIPGPMWTDILLLYLFPILIFLFLKKVAPYTTLFYTKFHKAFYTFRTKPKYGIFLKKNKKIPTGKMLLRILKISFLAFAFTGFFIPQFAELFRHNYNMMVKNLPNSVGLFNSEALFLGTFASIPIIMLVYFPIWFLEDTGVIAYRKFETSRMNPDIEGVNRIFRDFLEYFVGFTTIIVYLNRVYAVMYQETVGFTEINPSVLIPLILIFLPFLLGGLIAIPMLLYEFTFDKTNTQIHRYLSDNNYGYINIPEFEALEVKKQ